MAALTASAIALLVAAGVFLLLRARTFPVIVGLTLLSYAVNLFLLAMGRLGAAAPPIVTPGAERYADPLPQALILTAIVIGFGMTAFVVVLALRSFFATGSDRVDGRAPVHGHGPADRRGLVGRREPGAGREPAL